MSPKGRNKIYFVYLKLKMNYIFEKLKRLKHAIIGLFTMLTLYWNRDYAIDIIQMNLGPLLPDIINKDPTIEISN